LEEYSLQEYAIAKSTHLDDSYDKFQNRGSL
jgi:hypothetical protein